MTFDLAYHMHRLLRYEPFFATFSRKIEKVENNSIPTAAVCFNRETQRFLLMYNSSFMESLPDEHKLGVIKHEFYHLILQHLTVRVPFEPTENPEKFKDWNIAADLAINTHIADELPKMACVPGKYKFKDYPVGLSTEAYFEMLTQDRQNQTGPFKPSPSGKPKEPDTLDDHSQWGSGEDNGSIQQEVKQEKFKQMIKESTLEAEGTPSGWGTVPREIRRHLKKIITPTISPEKVLRYFIKTSRRSFKTTTVRKVNRRFPYIHPGHRYNNVANIAVSIDQSHSVNDEMLEIFFSFLNKFASIATFTVVPFDTEVLDDKVYVWRKGEKRKRERVLDGGTDFNAPTKWVNKRNFDGHIIITDMQAGKPVASKCQRLWITTLRNKRYCWFKTNEKVLAIDV